MRKRIYLKGQAFNGLDTVDVVDVEENLLRYENDGVSVLRVRAGTQDRWFPNWRIIEVADVPDDPGPEDEQKIDYFSPVTPEDLGYRDVGGDPDGSFEGVDLDIEIEPFDSIDRPVAPIPYTS